VQPELIFYFSEPEPVKIERLRNTGYEKKLEKLMKQKILTDKAKTKQFFLNKN